MVSKATFKKKFPDVKVQKVETAAVLSRAEVEEIVLKMCDSLNTGLLYYSYSNRWITCYTSDMMKEALDAMTQGSEVLHPHYGVIGKVVSHRPFIISGELCVRIDFGDLNKSGTYSCMTLIM